MTVDEANAAAVGTLPGLLGVVFTRVEPGAVDAVLAVRREVLSPNGFLHGGTVAALADTACGFGTVATIGSMGFATVDLQCNYLGTALDGTVTCEARLRHGGRTTQVWDATVTRDDGRQIAVFRCTQLILEAARPAP